jgi:nucleoside-diphosphate-sugar epimerase
MRKPVVLITGANGELGHALIGEIGATRIAAVAALDVNALDASLGSLVQREYTGSVLDKNLLERILAEFEVDLIFHLAALLSTRSEFTPTAAHHVNVEGTLSLLEFAQRQGESHGRPVAFIYPSSIAAYGLPDEQTRRSIGRIKEDEWNVPITMYGCNKLYCEQVGRYYAKHYKQLSEATPRRVDFRCVRFPGLISAETTPSGGTSDYASEMIHAAARGEPYDCFVRPDTRIPFMAMPDAIRSLLAIAAAPREKLTRTAYNVCSFNPTADQIRGFVTTEFPEARIGYRIDPRRQAIVDSWPTDIDDSCARRDWGFAPYYDERKAFHEYLFPTIRKRYGRSTAS